jgi:glycosyltransferase involved in cell wall biosynthesis
VRTETRNPIMSIMLIGVDFYPYHTPSDKNFWLSILNEIRKEYSNLQVISFVNRKPNRHIVKYDDVSFTYFRFLPFLSPYSPITGFFARLMVILLNLFTIHRILKHNDIKVIHFIDNFGIAMPLIKLLNKKIKITLSLPASMTTNNLYNSVLRASCHNLDKIVVFTETLKKRLSTIGMNRQKIDVIRWGVNVISERFEPHQNSACRLILWTGFLTQVWEEDFFFAIRAAKKVLRTTDKCKFVFCFKPHSFNNKYKRYEARGIEIQPKKLTYNQLVNSSDIYFCPIKNQNKIIAPPLTWIEMMSNGKPLITTPVKGAHEIVENGINGYICKDEKSIVDNLLILTNNHNHYKKMSQYAMESIKNNFNLQISFQKYRKLWGHLHGQI